MKKVLILGMGMLLAWGCNSSSNPQGNAQDEVSIVNLEEAHDHENSNALELNNGERWVVNEEMKPFVVNGRELTNRYLEEEDVDYSRLAVQLKEQNDLIVRNCTMTGKSHDELHKWLHPHMELVKKLSEAENKDLARAELENIEKSYKDYEKYFQ